MGEVLAMRRNNYIAFLPFYLLAVILCIGLAHGGSQAVTTLGESAPVAREHTIIIDAGHGGIDGGATSCTGILESTINLQIALRLDDLMHFLGYQTCMIRTTDTSIYTQGNTIAAQKVSDLKERVRIVNETEDAILISIHQNTFSDSRYGGAQVFYPKTDGSKELASAMQGALITIANPDSKRVCKKADGVYLMEHIEQTGILIECGFLSNPEEEALLRSDDYQKKLCGIIAATVGSFLLDCQTND